MLHIRPVFVIVLRVCQSFTRNYSLVHVMTAATVESDYLADVAQSSTHSALLLSMD